MIERCEICGKEMSMKKMHYYEEGGYFVCPECYEEEFVTCERCGASITADDAYKGNDGYLCEYCHSDLYD